MTAFVEAMYVRITLVLPLEVEYDHVASLYGCLCSNFAAYASRSRKDTWPLRLFVSLSHLSCNV
jgi:hypothetical protein